MIRWKLHEVMSRKRVRNKDLAQLLGITENSVYRLRKADEMPRLTPERLEGICAALGCQPGELLQWEGSAGVAIDASAVLGGDRYGDSVAVNRNAVLVERSMADQYKAMPKTALQRLNEFYPQILALAWRGYQQYGAGAVVFTDSGEGVQIAYVEQGNLADPGCVQAIEQTRPELAAVVLYYPSSDYTGQDYEVLKLTGAKTPPEYHHLLDKPQ